MTTVSAPQSEPSVVTLFLVDDHPVLRRGLKMVFEQQDGWRVCGEADEADTAFTEIQMARPDIVIADVSLQSGNGLDLVKRLKSAMPSMPVVVFSACSGARYAEHASRAGADDYVEKGDDIGRLMDAIRRILPRSAEKAMAPFEKT